MTEKRIGTITAGIFLLLLGVLLLVHMITGAAMSRIWFEIWPATLVALGIEILYRFYAGRDGKLRYDFVSMAVLFLVGTAAAGLYTLQASGLLDVIKTATQYSVYTVDVKSKALPVTKDINQVIIENGMHDVNIKVARDNDIVIRGTATIAAPTRAEAQRIARADSGYSVRLENGTLTIKAHRIQSRTWFTVGKIQQSPLDITVPAKVALEVDSVSGNVNVSADAVEKDWFVKLAGGSLDAVVPEKTNALITAQAAQVIGDLELKDTSKKAACDTTDTPIELQLETRQLQLGKKGAHLRFIDQNGTAAIFLR